MANPRTDHTATLLDNGKVLIAGGAIPGVALSSAELYDPISNSWSSVASMAAAREGPTATLLGNGKVLVTGGVSGGGFSTPVLSSSELFDPSNDTWSPAASMATARFKHTATLLSDGDILVTGGEDLISYQDVWSSAELYDPATDTWSSAGDMAAARQDHTATPLGNGKVLIAGGSGSSCELYLYGASLAVAGFPSNTAVGVTGTFTVTAENGDGSINVGFTGTVHFTSSDSKAILPPDYTFAAADHGVHTFSATFKTAGTQGLAATDIANGFAEGVEGGIQVWDPAAANPSQSTISVAPGIIFSGGSATVTLTAINNAGNPMTTGGLSFNFGATGGNLFSSAVFTNLTDNHNGTYTATFTGTTALSPATYTISATLNGQAIATPLPTITVVPAVPATQLAITNLRATSVAPGPILRATCRSPVRLTVVVSVSSSGTSRRRPRTRSLPQPSL
jgi:hypothetical protein